MNNAIIIISIGTIFGLIGNVMEHALKIESKIAYYTLGMANGFALFVILRRNNG